MSSKQRQQLEDWLKGLNIEADKILDIGGSQLPVLKRLGSVKYNEYKILDLENPHELKQKPDIVMDLNNENDGSVHFSLNSDGLSDYDELLFDVVFCLEVTEYWYNPVQAIENIAQFMRPGGELYISFHFVYPAHNPIKQDYLRYTKAGIEKILEVGGFEIISITPRVTEVAHLTIVYNAEGMRGNPEIDPKEVGYLVRAKKI